MRLNHVQLLLKRSTEQQEALDSYVESLGTKGSPEFHHWLTAEEFGERFGVAEPDIAAVTDWLKAHGLEVSAVYPNRMTIDFSGTAAQVQTAFRVEMRSYDVNGERHIANDRNPSIPAALAPAVAGVVSLNDFYPRPQVTRLAPMVSSSSQTWPITPADLATIYNLSAAFKAGYTGKGQTIVAIEDSNIFSVGDWTTFRSATGLAGYTTGSLSQVHPAARTGAACQNPGAVPGLDVESIIDAEYLTAAAPGAAIEVASCASTATTFGGLIAIQNVVNASGSLPAVMNISFGECETLNGAAANAAYSAAYEQAAAEGISVFVAAGDGGGATCDAGSAAAVFGLSVNGLASSAYNVAVGGTDFADTYDGTNSQYWNSSASIAGGQAKSYVPEIPWNDSCAGSLLAGYEKDTTAWGSKGLCNSPTGAVFIAVTAGGGGPSACATGYSLIPGVADGSCSGRLKPSWQSVTGNPKDGVRDLPDVALFAGDGLWRHYYLFCNSDVLDSMTGQSAACTKPVANWASGGGTSFAAPVMAGIQALVDQKYGRQGNPAPVYYRIAAEQETTSGAATDLGNDSDPSVKETVSQSCLSSAGSSIGSGCIFHDVAQGDSDVVCVAPFSCYTPSGVYGVLTKVSGTNQAAYSAAAGWDFATGLGSVNAYNLVISTEW
jgi:subtilase family serine protease